VANTTFGNLKINLLRQKGNNYNSSDATLLILAGQCINNALGIIQTEIKGHPFTLDINNTVTSTITTPYKTDLVDTDIIEILQVSQRVDPRKLIWIPYTEYMEYMADPTRLAGTPNWYWTAIQNLNVSGVNIWSLFFIPTPSSAITIYYDYEKNIQFTSDGTAADSSFSPLPTTYDKWIFDEAAPMLYEIMDSKNTNLITRAAATALESRARYKTMILSGADTYRQVQSQRERGPYIWKQVATVTSP